MQATLDSGIHVWILCMCVIARVNVPGLIVMWDPPDGGGHARRQ